MKLKKISGLFSTVPTVLSTVPKQPYTFKGKVTRLDAPIGAGVPVILHDRATGVCIETSETDADSFVVFQNLDKTKSYYIVAIDAENLFQSIVYDLTWQTSNNFDYNPNLQYTDKLAQSSLKDFYNYYQQESLLESDALVFSISSPSVYDDNVLTWNASGSLVTDIIDDYPSFIFNASSRYLYLETTPTYAQQPFTFETFFQIDNLKASTTHYLFTQVATGTLRHSFYIDDQGYLTFSRDYAPAISVRSLSKIKDGWNHAALTFDGNNLHLFLNGKLEATAADTIGLQGFQNHFGIGYLLSGAMAYTSWKHSCEYLTDFQPKTQNHSKKQFKDINDVFDSNVVLKTEVRSNSVQSLMVDKAKHMPFTIGATSLIQSNSAVSINNSFARSTVMSSDYVLKGDFCIELTYSLHSTATYPTLFSNQSVTSEWIANNWALTVNHASSRNKYAIYRANLTTLVSTYPMLLREITTIAIDKQGTTVKVFFNGFLVDTFTNVTAFDTRLSSYIAFGRDISYTLYDAKLTNSVSRYQSDYTPTWLSNWTDQNLAAEQHILLNLSFKKSLVNFSTKFQAILNDVSLSSAKSVNGTKSAFFKEAQLLLNSDFYVPREMFTLELRVYLNDQQEDFKTIVQLYRDDSNILRIGYNASRQLCYVLAEGEVVTLEDVVFKDNFDHLVIQRQGSIFKILFEGELVATIPFSLVLSYVSLSVMSNFDRTNAAEGYVNNLYLYKNYLKYSDSYEVPYEEIVQDTEEKEPEVVVTPYTTSALNFENGLVDKIGTTVWQKEGTAGITTTNKIFGDNSFETKVIGDSLYTSSNVITGGSTPFTIEFYALVKTLAQTDVSTYINIISGDHLDYSTNGQGLYLHKTNKTIVYYRYLPDNLDIHSNLKISFNDINKITMTYDGACIRVFINDVLDIIVGTSSGFIKRDFLSFFKSQGSASLGQIFGLVDNVNIHDGIATKVRDHDPYEEFLAVDLAFDGENNSTKIVDNGVLKSNWLINYNNPTLKTINYFDNQSALYLNGRQNIKSDIDVFFDEVEDFTFSFEFVRISSSQEYIVLISTNTKNYQTDSAVFSINAFTNNYPNSAASFLRNKLSFIDEKNFDKDVSNSLISKTNILDNVKYKIDIVRKNKITYLYINNVLDTQSNIFSDRAVNFGKLCLGHCAWSESSYTQVGLNGYIKNFKIYKGAAVIPEDPTGKIQLEFDKNVIDKYGNSTWTNNGVMFDQVNSVKGHAAYFNQTSSRLTSGVNNNFNFEDKNFLISCDIKRTISSSSANILTSGATSYPTNWVEIFCRDNILGYNNQIHNYSLEVPFGLPLNNYYKFDLVHKNIATHIKINDVIVGCEPSKFLTNNFNANGNTVIGGSMNTNQQFNGYIDNFKSIKDYKENVIIDKPAVHLPLETNATNIGFTPLTINSVGSPTYTVIDNKKCIKFESGKYLSIDSNNIFNLGTHSDFYIELDFYPLPGRSGFVLLSSGSLSADSNLFTITCAELFNGLPNKVYTYLGGTAYKFEGSYNYNSWNNIKIFRKGTNTTYILNGISIGYENLTFNYASQATATIIGNAAYSSTVSYNGYMSNFKMFVGTSQPPETYNDKKVLDLDFKPTRKSYLFKDNNNKCVIHPVNITQRDYKDSQYCCTFNGVNQHLEIGKNELFNFGLDDFVLYFKININNIDSTENKDDVLIYNNIPWATGSVGISRYVKSNRLTMGLYGTTGFISNNTFINGINEIYIIRQGSTLTMKLNDVSTIFNNFNYSLNFNAGDNTFIGKAWNNAVNTYFVNSIYSVKVLRNTTDLSLLEDYKKPALELKDYIVASVMPTLYSGTGSYIDPYGVIWVGNTSVTTFQGTPCFVFNSGQYLRSTDPNAFNFGTRDFSVKLGLYQTASSGYVSLFASGDTATNNLDAIATNPTTQAFYLHKAPNTGSATPIPGYNTNPPIQLNNWVDVFLVRNGLTLTLKVGNNEMKYLLSEGTIFNFGFNSFSIGTTPYPYTSLSGYIRDFTAYKDIDILSI